MDLTSIKELKNITSKINYKKTKQRNQRPSKFLEANTRSAIYRQASFLYSDFQNQAPPPPPPINYDDLLNPDQEVKGEEDGDQQGDSSVDSSDQYLYESMKFGQKNPTLHQAKAQQFRFNTLAQKKSPSHKKKSKSVVQQNDDDDDDDDDYDDDEYGQNNKDNENVKSQSSQSFSSPESHSRKHLTTMQSIKEEEDKHLQNDTYHVSLASLPIIPDEEIQPLIKRMITYIANQIIQIKNTNVSTITTTTTTTISTTATTRKSALPSIKSDSLSGPSPKIRSYSYNPVIIDKTPAPPSKLSESMNQIAKAGGVIKKRFFLQPPQLNSPMHLNLRVYLLCTPKYINIKISKTNTIQQIIKHILTCYDLDPQLCKNPLPFPDIHEAYQLRLLEDDCDYMPDFEINPLENSRKIGNFGKIDAIALTNNANFDEKKYQGADDANSKENLLILKKLTSANQEKIGLRVYIKFNEAGYSSKVLLAKNEDTLRDILLKLQQKLDEGALHPEQFYFIPYQKQGNKRRPSTDVSESFDPFAVDKEFEQDALDMDLPVELLQTGEIELKRRIRKDEPINSLSQVQSSFLNSFDPRLTDFSKMQTYLEQALTNVGTLMDFDQEIESDRVDKKSVNSSGFEDQGKDEEDFLLNSNTANQYKQYVIIKINIRGKRQERVIGIDGHYIYNKKPMRKQTMIHTILHDKFGSHFDKTHHSNWPIEQIDTLERLQNRRVRIKFKDEKKYNRLILEFKTKTETSQFTAKLRFLLTQLKLKNRGGSVMI